MLPRTTIADVATRCGVSASTVSKALSLPARYHLADPLRRRIRLMAAGMGYHRTEAVPQRCRDVVICEVRRVDRNDLLTQLLRHLGEQARARGCALITRLGSHPAPLVGAARSHFRQRGVLRQLGAPATEDVVPGTPMAVVGEGAGVEHGGVAVDLDWEGGFRLLVDHGRRTTGAATVYLPASAVDPWSQRLRRWSLTGIPLVESVERLPPTGTVITTALGQAIAVAQLAQWRAARGFAVHLACLEWIDDPNFFACPYTSLAFDPQEIAADLLDHLLDGSPPGATSPPLRRYPFRVVAGTLIQ